MNFKKNLSLFKKYQSNRGYTLTELLIGASISIVVIGAAGMGLMNLMKGNKDVATQADKRTEINRALEFISDEIRKAETIEVDPTTAFTDADTNLNFDPTTGQADAKDNAQPILALNIPGVSDQVLYYISPPESNSWKGPRVIYRFGPSLDASGNYTNATNPAGWTTEPLIDGISDSGTPSCAGWTASPSSDVQGFFACIETNGKTAKIFAVGTLENNEKYEANAQAYARAENNPLTPAALNANFQFDNCVPGDGTINCPQGEYTFEALDSQYGFNADGDQWEVTTVIYQDDGTILGTVTKDSPTTISLSGNTELYFLVIPNEPAGATNGYADYNPPLQNKYPVVSDETVQPNTSDPNFPTDTDFQDLQTDSDFELKYNADAIVVLEDGDTFPNNIPDQPWLPPNDQSGNPSQGVKAILKNEKGNNKIKSTNENVVDDDGYVQIDSTQKLVIFEIGQIDNIDESDPNNTGLDWQDNVLLITKN